MVIVSNPTVDTLYLSAVESSLAKTGRKIARVLVPDGESFKTLETLLQIHTRLLELGADRRTTLLAVGGGVIGDLVGFAAATYQRGIPFVQMPTTLLAQVDSSVGGKTGVNHPLGKNMIGAFYQPRAVVIDVGCLRTLPSRELSAGIAEVVKYGMIWDASFFTWLEQALAGLLSGDQTALVQAIRRSCEIKAAVVGRDERESGERAILNFGHTFGHAIEAGLGYGVWLHGEAVAAGMVLATELSRRRVGSDSSLLDRLVSLLRQANLPTVAPDLGRRRYLELMRHDKKADAGRLRLVLLRGLGDAQLVDDVPDDAIAEVLGQFSVGPTKDSG